MLLSTAPALGTAQTIGAGGANRSDRPPEVDGRPDWSLPARRLREVRAVDGRSDWTIDMGRRDGTDEGRVDVIVDGAPERVPRAEAALPADEPTVTRQARRRPRSLPSARRPAPHSLCVFTSTGGCNVTVTSENGTFELRTAPTATTNVIPYTAERDDGAIASPTVAYNTAKTGLAGDDKNLDCGGAGEPADAGQRHAR